MAWPRAPAGSALWLLAHELRLMYRDARGRPIGTVGALLLFVALHALAVPLVLGIKLFARLSPIVPLAMISGLGTLSLITLWARALTLTVQSLYERGDVELLVASPLPPRVWFGVRAGAIALRSASEYALLLVPIANVFIASGEPRWLLAYLALPLGALLATSAALWLALGLLRLLGPQRTRVLSQIVAALVAVAAAVMLQLPALYGYDHDSRGALAALTRLPGPQSSRWLPAKTVMGETPWSVLAAVGCLGGFLISVQLLAAPFCAGLTSAAHADVTKRARRRALPRFRWGPRGALILKELRVMLRDPWLITQLMQQNLLLLPAALMFTRWQLHGVSMAWLALVMCAGSSAGALAWLASSGEEAPELIGSAPIGRLDCLLAQLVASLTPVSAGVVLCCAVLALRHPVAAWLIGLCALGNAGSNALCNLRLKRPGKRREFRRRNQANIAGLLTEIACMSVWVSVCTLALSLSG